MLCAEFDTQDSEILIALLSVYPFEGFQEFETHLQAYISEEDWNKVKDIVMRETAGVGTFKTIEPLPDKNWNAIWEASFQPVVIDDFCAIRAGFHDPITTSQHEIVIDPKMAFGTGHHETTELMIRQMRNLDFKGKTILDLGCGTGILAILAIKLGALEVLAVDNDPEAVSNAKENAAINNVHITCRHGVATDLPSHAYDIILANINRNVLLDIMSDLKRILRSGGQLLLSGILITDRSLIVHAAWAQHFQLQKEQSLGEWLSLHLKSN